MRLWEACGVSGALSDLALTMIEKQGELVNVRV